MKDKGGRGKSRGKGRKEKKRRDRLTRYNYVIIATSNIILAYI